VRVGQGKIDLRTGEGCERAPRAADKVQIAALRHGRGILADHLLQLVAQLVAVAAAYSGQPQGPGGQAASLAHLAIFHRHQFEAAAADIGNDTARAGKGAQHAFGAYPRFVDPAQQARLQPQRLHLGEEILAVLRIAHCRGCDSIDSRHFKIGEDQRKALERAHRQIDRILGKQAVLVEVAPQAGGHFLVEQRGGRARRPAIDDQTHGVGADIDDRAKRFRTRNPTAVVALPACHQAAPRRSASLGTAPASSAPPRPESEGLVMK
jgi:hypothetical protein